MEFLYSTADKALRSFVLFVETLLSIFVGTMYVFVETKTYQTSAGKPMLKMSDSVVPSHN